MHGGKLILAVGLVPELRFSAPASAFGLPGLLPLEKCPDRGFLGGMTLLEKFEMLSYLVTVIGLPLALLTFIWEQRKERRNEEEEIFQRLSDEYREFLKLVLDNADLHLLRREGLAPRGLTAEQAERRHVIFGILVSLFERAYLLVYEERMTRHTRRLWRPWEDYMREWLRRAEFREALPELLEGEDEDFTAYIRQLATETPAADLPDENRPLVAAA